MNSSSEQWNASIEELKQWSDEEILSFFQHAKRDGEDLRSSWNDTVHQESLFIDFYDEDMVNIYTDVEKAKLYKRLTDDGLVEETDDDRNNLETLDCLLEEFNFLIEDAEKMRAWSMNPMNLFFKYIFKWMLMSQQWGDEFFWDLSTMS